MTSPTFKKLDNPAWYSLTETHRDLALGTKDFKIYREDVCAFAGVSDATDINQIHKKYIPSKAAVYLIGQKPVLPSQLFLEKQLVCLQMIFAGQNILSSAKNIIRLKQTHQKKLYELVNRVQPGYFKTQTPLMGNYYGIFKDHVLVAVTGERMKMFDFTEISAVITHPQHLGMGYATRLMSHTVNENLKRKVIPYLHVLEQNLGAISLYKKLGFKIRRKISFWQIGRKLNQQP